MPTPKPRPRAPDDVPQRLDQRLALQVWAFNDAFERRLAAELAPLGLTVAGFRLIGELLGAPDGLRVGTLAERLGVTAPSVTGMVDRFVAAGLVQRVPDPDDARAARVRLAPDAPLQEGVAVLDRLERALEAALGEDERAPFARALGQLTAGLGAPSAAPTHRSRS